MNTVLDAMDILTKRVGSLENQISAHLSSRGSSSGANSYRITANISSGAPNSHAQHHPQLQLSNGLQVLSNTWQHPPLQAPLREFSLASAYHQFASNGHSASAGSPEQLTSGGQYPRAVRTQYDYASHSLPDVVSVSPALRQAVVQGKDINLSAILIPDFRGSGDSLERLDLSKEPTAPNKPLTILNLCEPSPNTRLLC